jgi:hypothetical protein
MRTLALCGGSGVDARIVARLRTEDAARSSMDAATLSRWRGMRYCTIAAGLHLIAAARDARRLRWPMAPLHILVVL